MFPWDTSTTCVLPRETNNYDDIMNLWCALIKLIMEDKNWVLLARGFNGFQQLDGQCFKEERLPEISVTTPKTMVTVSSPARPYLKISSTWDSIHISSLNSMSTKEHVTCTTGRWKKIINDCSVNDDVYEIKQVGRSMILKTESDIVIVTQDSKTSVQDLSGVNYFCVLEDESVYALFKNGSLYTCTLSPDHSLMSCGPQMLTDGVPISKVSCGADHVLILSQTGSLFSFGLNSRGQLGHGDIVSRSNPTLLVALDGMVVKDIACGHWHCLALSEYGDVYSWGWNKHGQLGHSEHTATIAIPTLVNIQPPRSDVSEDVNIVSVSSGSKHSVVLSSDGVVYGWGWNGYRQLGGVGEVVTIPTRIELSDGLRPVTVYCSYWNTLILCCS